MTRVLQAIRLVPNKKGGFEKYLLELTARSRQAGVELSFALLGQPHPEIEQALRDHGARVEVLHPDRLPMMALLRSLMRVVRDVRPDLIVGQFSPMGAAAVLAGRLAGVPTLRSVRATSVQYREHVEQTGGIWPPALLIQRNRWQNRIIGRLATGYLAVSEAVKRDLVEHYGVPAGKIVVQYNGVDTERYRPSAEVRARKRAELSIPDGQPVVFNAAMARPEKRVEDFIDAVHIAGGGARTAFLALHAGGGELIEALHARARALGLGDRLRFLGYRTDIDELLALCDIFVLPSKSEACSRALLEAMASGCAILATDVEGNGELLHRGACGVLVEPENPEVLARALETLLADERLRADLSARARETAVRVFDQDHRLAAELDLYRSLAEAV